MHYIIMADGKGTRWDNYKDMPKHFIMVHGETLLERTVRLLHHFDQNAEVIITSHDPRYEIPGSIRYEPKENHLEIDRFTSELIADNICFLYGDTYYTESTIQAIVNEVTKDVLFFGNDKSIVAVKIADGTLFKEHFLRVKKLFLSGEIKKCIGWQIYHSIIGTPLEQPFIGSHFYLVDASTYDVNTPEEYNEIISTTGDYND